MTNRFPEIERILSAISDGNASEVDRRHLNELLRHDAEARRFYMAWMDMEANLGEGAVDVAGDAMQEPVAPAGRNPAGRSYWTRVVPALAASILVCVGVWLGVQYYRSIAVLSSVSGEVVLNYGARVIRAETGMWLYSDVELFTPDNQGSAMITWKDGSTIRLPGKSRMALAEKAGQKQIALMEGYCEAEFRKQRVGRPAIVTGPYMSAEILGTTIRMDAKPDKTSLAVVEGKVRVKRMSDGRSVQISSRLETSAGNGVDDFEARHFHWAERFSGGAGGAWAIIQTCLFSGKRGAGEMRFKGSGGSGHAKTSMGEQRGE